MKDTTGEHQGEPVHHRDVGHIAEPKHPDVIITAADVIAEKKAAAADGNEPDITPTHLGNPVAEAAPPEPISHPHVPAGTYDSEHEIPLNPGTTAHTHAASSATVAAPAAATTAAAAVITPPTGAPDS